MKVFVKRKELVQPRRPDRFVFYAPHVTFITDSFVEIPFISLNVLLEKRTTEGRTLIFNFADSHLVLAHNIIDYSLSLIHI